MLTPAAALRRSALLLAVSALPLLAACPASVTPAELEAWGLPLDLHEKLDRLEELELTGEVDRLGWLRKAPALRRLTLRATRVATLAELPTTVNDLSLVDHDPTLCTFPSRLASLRLAADEIGCRRDSLVGIRLDVLRLEGRLVNGSPELPATLRRLALVDPGIDLSGFALPDSLLAFEYEGLALSSLGGLPSGLSKITLRKTSLTRLPALGTATRELAIEGTADLVVDHLPSLLTDVHLEGPVRLRTGFGDYVESLVLRDTGLGDVARLPTSLRRLELSTNADLATVAERCPDLVELKVDGRFVGHLEAIPTALPRLQRLRIFAPPPSLRLTPELRELGLEAATGLDLTGEASGIESLSLELTDLDALGLAKIEGWLARMPHLTSLSLARSRGARLPALPKDLKSLDLTGARFDAWSTSLPPGLVVLRLAGARIGRLPEIPTTVAVLDISNTDLELTALPQLPHLRELTLHPGQLARIGDAAASPVVLSLVP